jgi:hypothetical protein
MTATQTKAIDQVRQELLNSVVVGSVTTMKDGKKVTELITLATVDAAVKRLKKRRKH